MHSGKEKWDYYQAVSGEVYKIILDELSNPYSIIVRCVKEHLVQYNDKTNLYKFDILKDSESFDTGDFNFVMYEYMSIKRKLLFEKKFNLKGIIRRIKIDKLLGNE